VKPPPAPFFSLMVPRGSGRRSGTLIEGGRPRTSWRRPLGRGRLQQLLDRLGRRGGSRRRGACPYYAAISSAFPDMRRKERVGGKARQGPNTGGEAPCLVEFEGPFRIGSGLEGSTKAGKTARIRIRNQAFAPHPQQG
jgi:hypothetical protein